MDDFKAIDQFHDLRNANRQRAKEALLLAQADFEQAIHGCMRCVERISEYAFTVHEIGLIGQLIREDNEEYGWSGDFDVFEKLIRLLLKVKRPDEASAAAEAYFHRYPRDLAMVKAQKLRERITRAVGR